MLYVWLHVVWFAVWILLNVAYFVFKHDHELEDMKKPMHVEKLAESIDAAEQEMDPEKTRGPESAADTEV